MTAKVFISYRRNDSKYQARIIHAAFCQVLPREHVFMDVDSIQPGSDFRKLLKGWVDECEILLALVGTGWIDAIDPNTGQRRLENANDFVRIEVSAALARDIPVVPVLLDGTPMPTADALPNELKGLVDRQAEFVDYRTFDSDVERLITRLRLGAGTTRAASPTSVHKVSRSPAEDARMRADGRIFVDARIVQNHSGNWFKPGAGKTEWFKDLECGPEMVIVPSGEFLMGSSPSDIAALKKQYSSDWFGSEGPQRRVTVQAPFAVGRFPITFDEWDACVADGGCNGYRPSDYGWGRGKRPVIDVSWDDAKLYVTWLSAKTEKAYRLPSEAEREYSTRVGTMTPFWWGASISTNQANYDGNHIFGGGSKGEYRQKTVPVDNFDANAWGLYQVHGNVWEWVEDYWHENYQNAPSNASPWVQGGDASHCVLRGGSWFNLPRVLRAPSRISASRADRSNTFGFRVARTLDP